MSASSADKPVSDFEEPAYIHTAESRISTDRAKCYLGQLCRHAGKMGSHRAARSSQTGHAGEAPTPVLGVDCADTIGIIRFGDGRCTLEASDSTLFVRVEAGTAEGLRQLQLGIARRLETFGHRERLEVPWRLSDSVPASRPDLFANHVSLRGRHSAWRRFLSARNVGLAAVAAAILAAHLGALGGTLAATGWTEWGAGVILAVIVLKFAAAGAAHIGGGAFVLRYGKAFLADRKKPHAADTTQGSSEAEMARASTGRFHAQDEDAEPFTTPDGTTPDSKTSQSG